MNWNELKEQRELIKEYNRFLAVHLFGVNTSLVELREEHDWILNKQGLPDFSYTETNLGEGAAQCERCGRLWPEKTWVPRQPTLRELTEYKEEIEKDEVAFSDIVETPEPFGDCLPEAPKYYTIEEVLSKLRSLVNRDNRYNGIYNEIGYGEKEWSVTLTQYSNDFYIVSYQTNKNLEIAVKMAAVDILGKIDGSNG